MDDKRGDIIQAVEQCLRRNGCSCCENCPYTHVGDGFECREKLRDDIIALLKAQQPRVMTLKEIRDIYDYRKDHVWPFDTPPYLWVDTNRNTAPYWMSWSNVVDCLEERFPKYDPDYYGKTWRCWTSRPDEKVRAETPWERSMISA